MQEQFSRFDHLVAPPKGPTAFEVYQELTNIAEEIERCRASVA